MFTARIVIRASYGMNQLAPKAQAREWSSSLDRQFHPEPVFLAHHLRIMSEPRLIGAQHLKVPTSRLAKRPLATIWLNSAGAEQTVAGTNGITMAYTIEATGGTFLGLSVQGHK